MYSNDNRVILLKVIIYTFFRGWSIYIHSLKFCSRDLSLFPGYLVIHLLIIHLYQYKLIEMYFIVQVLLLLLFCLNCCHFCS